MSPPSSTGKWAARSLLLAAAFHALAGCGPLTHPGLRKLEHSVETRGLDADEILVPFLVDDEMRRWLEENVAGAPANQRLGRLMEALVTLEGLEIRYSGGRTGTAREVFQTREANCLAFSHLFVAMARELGLDAYFLRVGDVYNHFREGDLVISSGHVTAATGPATDRQILEFSALPAVDYRQVERLEDLTAVALFYSNRGAEAVREGDLDAALDWLETAVQLAPDLPDSWVNLGVARRRKQDLEGAVEAYRSALEADPGRPAAYHNLASLYSLQGETELAGELLKLTDRPTNRNPFTYVELGDLYRSDGDLETARRFYRRAHRLDPSLVAAPVGIGFCALDAGDLQEARRWLRKARRAQELGESHPGIEALERRLQAGS